jgi:signal peptidase II
LADTIRLEYVENTGGFLGLGGDLPAAWRTALFTVFTGVALSGMVVVAVRSRWRGWLLIGTSLVVTGGASNWIDRVVHGRVIDFLNLGVGPLRTGVFNVADVAIMVGAALLLLAGARPTNSDSRSGHAA